MLALGIDTSNYATSLAVVNCGSGEVVCAIKRFLPVKNGELGLRQSDAVFFHTKTLPEMLAELQNKCDFSNITAVGVAEKPCPRVGSYMPCFLAGFSFASAFAAAKGINLVQTSHQQGHLAAAISGTNKPSLKKQSLLFFHASGGTTQLLLTQGYSIKKQLGKSNDLYAGQAVDRLGVRLGFKFPAGVQLSNLAMLCSQTIKPKISVIGMDCHLSGLENQCQNLILKNHSPEYVAKYCLIFIAETAKQMLQNANNIYGDLPVLCAGGVMASDVIKNHLNVNKNIYFAPAKLSSDNAVGIALIAAQEIAND